MHYVRLIIGGLLLLWAIRTMSNDAITFEDNFWLWASGPAALGAAVSTLFTDSKDSK